MSLFPAREVGGKGDEGGGWERVMREVGGKSDEGDGEIGTRE